MITRQCVCVFVVDTWVELHFQQNRTPPNTSAGMFKPINVSNTQMEKLLLEAQRESSSRTSSKGVSQLSSRVGSNPSSRGRCVVVIVPVNVTSNLIISLYTVSTIQSHSRLFLCNGLIQVVAYYARTTVHVLKLYAIFPALSPLCSRSV